MVKSEELLFHPSGLFKPSWNGKRRSMSAGTYRHTRHLRQFKPDRPDSSLALYGNYRILCVTGVILRRG